MSEPNKPATVPSVDDIVTCSICGHSDDLWSNRALLGCDAVLCGYCAEAWYDGGQTDPKEILRLSTEDRATGRRESMKAKFGF
jgi:hypothetical protein